MYHRLFSAALFIAPALLLAKPMIVERVTVQQIEDGPIVLLDYDFRPSETVYCSFRLSGFETIENDDKQKLDLKYRIEVMDEDGTPAVLPFEGKLSTEMLPEDRNWTPKFRWSFALPDHASGGRYKIKVFATDLIGKTEASGVAEFIVRDARGQGRRVELSDTLVTRGFGFYKNEDDSRPLDPPVYHPRELVWVRFDVTGFKLGENNQLDVEYGLSVLEPSGKVSFSQPKAASEKWKGFYPKRVVPAVFNLTLPPNVKTGLFTLVVTIRDEIGKQDLELRREFTIE
jgi:hypothetical protein